MYIYRFRQLYLYHAIGTTTTAIMPLLRLVQLLQLLCVEHYWYINVLKMFFMIVF